MEGNETARHSPPDMTAYWQVWVDVDTEITNHSLGVTLKERVVGPTAGRRCWRRSVVHHGCSPPAASRVTWLWRAGRMPPTECPLVCRRCWCSSGPNTRCEDSTTVAGGSARPSPRPSQHVLAEHFTDRRRRVCARWWRPWPVGLTAVSVSLRARPRPSWCWCPNSVRCSSSLRWQRRFVDRACVVNECFESRWLEAVSI